MKIKEHAFVEDVELKSVVQTHTELKSVKEPHGWRSRGGLLVCGRSCVFVF